MLSVCAGGCWRTQLLHGGEGCVRWRPFPHTEAFRDWKYTHVKGCNTVDNFGNGNTFQYEHRRANRYRKRATTEFLRLLSETKALRRNRLWL